LPTGGFIIVLSFRDGWIAFLVILNRIVARSGLALSAEAPSEIDPR